MKYEVLMWEGNDIKEMHTFELPFQCDGWYRSVTSIQAYSTRENTRLYNANLKGKSAVEGKRGSVRWGLDTDLHPATGFPTTRHESVWDFYKAVGYDYKKQKYLDQPAPKD